MIKLKQYRTTNNGTYLEFVILEDGIVKSVYITEEGVYDREFNTSYDDKDIDLNYV